MSSRRSLRVSQRIAISQDDETAATAGLWLKKPFRTRGCDERNGKMAMSSVRRRFVLALVGSHTSRSAGAAKRNEAQQKREQPSAIQVLRDPGPPLSGLTLAIRQFFERAMLGPAAIGRCTIQPTRTLTGRFGWVARPSLSLALMACHLEDSFGKTPPCTLIFRFVRRLSRVTSVAEPRRRNRPALDPEDARP